MATGTITKRAVDAIKVGATDLFLWDDDLSGFGLKVTPAGAKVYGRTPISGFTKVKAALDLAMAEARGDKETPAPIKAWRIHDLRRTVATGFQRLGVRFEVTEAVLNHISGAKSGVAGIYQKHDWKDEKRTALDAWARHVAAIVTPAEQTNVVPLHKASGA